MFKFTPFFTKIALAVLVSAVALASIPLAGVSAAGMQEETTPPTDRPGVNLRLERVWGRMQITYERQGDRLAAAENAITRVQTLIDKANEKGWDTSSLQVALDAFAAVIPAAHAAHEPGAAIIAAHNGFDSQGKVTDRLDAVQTINALHQVLKDTRLAMDGTGRALREAVRVFRNAHRPASTPSIP
jgi:hypothetical protein